MKYFFGFLIFTAVAVLVAMASFYVGIPLWNHWMDIIAEYWKTR